MKLPEKMLGLIKFSTLILSSIFLLSIAVCHGADLRSTSATLAAPDPVTAGKGIYAVPNELTPIKAIPVLRRAPSGAYLSIGTERGFMSASLSPQITSLICFDYDHGAVLYDLVNAGLLKLSKNRHDYLNLRLTENFEQWRNRMKQIPLRAEIKQVLEKEETFQWWTTNVRERGDFVEFHEPAPSAAKAYPYKGANYLYDDVLFQRIHDLAMKDKISAFAVDLRDPSQVQALADAIRANNESLAIIDISNVWQWFGGTKNIENIEANQQAQVLSDAIGKLRGATTGKTVLLATTWGGEVEKFPKALAKPDRASRFPRSRYVSFSSTQYIGAQFSELPDNRSLWRHLRLGINANNLDEAYSYVELNGQPLYFDLKERGQAIAKLVNKLGSPNKKLQQEGLDGLLVLAGSDSRPNDAAIAIKANLARIQDTVVRESAQLRLIGLKQRIRGACLRSLLEALNPK